MFLFDYFDHNPASSTHACGGFQLEWRGGRGGSEEREREVETCCHNVVPLKKAHTYFHLTRKALVDAIACY